jgi:hypothetical protein
MIKRSDVVEQSRILDRPPFNAKYPRNQEFVAIRENVSKAKIAHRLVLGLVRKITTQIAS